MKNIGRYLPGLLFTLLIAYLSITINDLLKVYINLEALTIAIIIGIIYNNTIGTQPLFKDGIKFSLKRLLILGIILLGFKLNFYSILELGPKVLLMVLFYVPLTLYIAVVLGKKFKVNNKLATLIGIGSSICGASAVVAIAPTINADDDESIVAVSIVNFLGAIGVLIYSSIVASNIQLSEIQYGAWSGLSLHGVAHALAAAFALGEQSGEIGTLVKMTRVLMLIPVSLFLGLMFKSENNSKTKIKFPMYIVYFVFAGVVNSLGFIPESLTSLFIKLSGLFILMAMTAMGISVDYKNIIKKGKGALIVGSLLFLVVSIISLIVILNIL
ncbi:putative sulfate exporter family transporter [Mycoplasmatota bacterium WC44]